MQTTAFIYPLLRSCILKKRSVILVKTQENAGVYPENTSVFHFTGAAMFSLHFECPKLYLNTHLGSALLRRVYTDACTACVVQLVSTSWLVLIRRPAALTRYKCAFAGLSPFYTFLSVIKCHIIHSTFPISSVRNVFVFLELNFYQIKYKIVYNISHFF